MTQKEIIARANKAVNDAFEQGADMERKMVIAKACRWLRKNIDLYAMDTVNAGTKRHKIVLMSNFEETFSKAMEE